MCGLVNVWLWFKAVAVSLIALALYGRAKSYLVDFSVLGGVIACGVLLFMIAIIGLVATVLHHQVTLFFVSFTVDCVQQ